jgi:hypothetical protein
VRIDNNLIKCYSYCNINCNSTTLYDSKQNNYSDKWILTYKIKEVIYPLSVTYNNSLFNIENSSGDDLKIDFTDNSRFSDITITNNTYIFNPFYINDTFKFRKDKNYYINEKSTIIISPNCSIDLSELKSIPNVPIHFASDEVSISPDNSNTYIIEQEDFGYRTLPIENTSELMYIIDANNYYNGKDDNNFIIGNTTWKINSKIFYDGYNTTISKQIGNTMYYLNKDGSLSGTYTENNILTVSIKNTRDKINFQDNK